MAKLRVMSGKEVCAVLNRFEFVEVRRRGSHIIIQRIDEDGGTKTVPVPDHREIKKGTLRSIIRQSGVAREEFEN